MTTRATAQIKLTKNKKCDQRKIHSHKWLLVVSVWPFHISFFCPFYTTTTISHLQLNSIRILVHFSLSQNGKALFSAVGHFRFPWKLDSSFDINHIRIHWNKMSIYPRVCFFQLTFILSLSLLHFYFFISNFLLLRCWIHRSTIKCVDGYPYINNCPSGLHFDDIAKYCTFKSEARCGPIATSK